MIRVYSRYEIEAMPASDMGGPMAGRDTVLGRDVVLYWWKPDAAATAEIESSEKGVETFADLSHNYLVAPTEQAARAALAKLGAAGVFPEVFVPAPKDEVGAAAQDHLRHVEFPPADEGFAQAPRILSAGDGRAERRRTKKRIRLNLIYVGALVLLAAGAIWRVLWTPAPTVALHLDHTVITEGEPLQLSWEATYAKSVSIEPGLPSEPVKGTATVRPRKTTTYVITAKGRSGTVETGQQVLVDPPLSIIFTTDRSTVTRGEATVVRWTVTGAESTVLLPDNARVGSYGAKRVEPTQKTTYRLTATRPSGRTEYREISVDVLVPVISRPPVIPKPPASPPLPPPTILSFSAEPNPVPICGSVTVQWNVRNAGRVSINPGIPNAESHGSKTIRIAKPKMLELRATGIGESAQQSLQLALASLPRPGPPPCGEFVWSGVMPAAGPLEIGFQGGRRSDPPGSIEGDGLPHMLTRIIPAEDFVVVTGQPFELNAAKVVVSVMKSGNLSLHFWWERSR